ncbi:hypothetical protein FA13DRAFT_1742612 [Coprinellus micaceus]|uniref:Uncharacterized protein n=1 Tax=Coprinellus micaceus TaxID=71717 RepID=A0A4Y7SI56_COPMI|nr:hypothetical protein FA13DRAFT_1742612 [Coprinellus micaceus]
MSISSHPLRQANIRGPRRSQHEPSRTPRRASVTNAGSQVSRRWSDAEVEWRRRQPVIQLKTPSGFVRSLSLCVAGGGINSVSQAEGGSWAGNRRPGPLR